MRNTIVIKLLLHKSFLIISDDEALVQSHVICERECFGKRLTVSRRRAPSAAVEPFSKYRRIR